MFETCVATTLGRLYSDNVISVSISHVLVSIVSWPAFSVKSHLFRLTFCFQPTTGCDSAGKQCLTFNHRTTFNTGNEPPLKHLTIFNTNIDDENFCDNDFGRLYVIQIQYEINRVNFVSSLVMFSNYVFLCFRP